ncbi:hypothetical protein ACJX0J_007867, partial [Zea mays]
VNSFLIFWLGIILISDNARMLQQEYIIYVQIKEGGYMKAEAGAVRPTTRSDEVYT